MLKHFYPLLLFLSLSINVLAQEASISSKFSQDGNLYENADKFSNPIAQFKENEKCIVTNYLGNYTYKIKYKDLIGFVKDQYLFVNEQMMDLYFDHEEKQRQKAIEEKKKRQEKIKEIQRQVIEKEALIEQGRKDSIAKIIEEKNRTLALKRKKDSIVQALREQNRILAEKQRNDSIAQLRENERIQLKIKRKNDSMAAAKAEQKRKLTEQRKKDSIVQALREQNRLLVEKQRNDSIAQVRENERIQIEIKRKNDSMAAAKAEQKRKLTEQRKKDSIAQVLKEQNKLVAGKQKNNAITKIKEEKRKENELSEKMKFRNTCHYQINEYDDFYKEKFIVIEPYKITDNLTAVLFRQGNSINIFFNLSEDLGCASYLPNQRSIVKITLQNNQTITFYHSWDIDCGTFSFKARLSNTNMGKLKKSPIKSVMLKGTKSSAEIKNIGYKEFFIDKLKCIE